jgi:hypothetical protein
MIFTDAKDLFGVAIIYSIGKAKQWKYLNFGIVLAIIKMDPQPPTPPPALENLWTNIATTAGASDSLLESETLYRHLHWQSISVTHDNQPFSLLTGTGKS